LDKKSEKEKNLKEIEKEIKKAKESGYQIIKLSCNTDIRKDFLEILKLIKKYEFKIILETNTRMFSYPNFLKRANKYIDQYEPYLNFSNEKTCQDIVGVENAYNQTIKGIKNISKLSNKEIIVKIVLIKDVSALLFKIIDQISKIKIKKIKLVYPFKINQSDPIPSLVDIAPEITQAKKFAKDKGIKILNEKELEYNPFLPNNLSFFDENQAKLEVDYKKFKNKPKFSIVIPTHNRKNNLKMVLENFFKQDYPKEKYEIIVVDDGSSDKTKEMVKKLKPTSNFKYFYWPRIKIPLEKNIKKWNKFYNRAGLARNIGINNSQGKIILFNDSDILIEKDCLKKHEKYHKKYPKIMVKGFRMFLPENSRDLNEAQPEKTERGIKLHCRMYDLSKGGWERAITANLSVKKKYLEKVNGFDKDFVFWGSEDVDLAYRLSKLKMKFVWDSQIKIYHLYHQKESPLDLGVLSWLGANLLYRKYLDESIFNVYRNVVLYRLDDLLC